MYCVVERPNQNDLSGLNDPRDASDEEGEPPWSLSEALFFLTCNKDGSRSASFDQALLESIGFLGTPSEDMADEYPPVPPAQVEDLETGSEDEESEGVDEDYLPVPPGHGEGSDTASEGGVNRYSPVPSLQNEDSDTDRAASTKDHRPVSPGQDQGSETGSVALSHREPEVSLATDVANVSNLRTTSCHLREAPPRRSSSFSDESDDPSQSPIDPVPVLPGSVNTTAPDAVLRSASLPDQVARAPTPGPLPGPSPDPGLWYHPSELRYALVDANDEALSDSSSTGSPVHTRGSEMVVFNAVGAANSLPENARPSSVSLSTPSTPNAAQPSTSSTLTHPQLPPTPTSTAKANTNANKIGEFCCTCTTNGD